ncbi:hypothetical protein LAZ67_13001329 [Cordylochernes scorpioides]|uniref:Mos1 transposase HTH domain-containing protein n=1 Tax=Cordylochernes scorpioides TaxID=51811 RepID=A0ABY6L686_9ARAC|nr:hypothetical protein LAZ67_13001329 [Cordylochernes scorpioides]
MSILCQICILVSHAEQNIGLVHNDISPRNILIRPTAQKVLNYDIGGENYEIPTNNCIAKLKDLEISRLVKNDDPNPNVFYENVSQLIWTHNEMREFNSAYKIHTEFIEETSTQIAVEESQKSHSETEALDKLGVPYFWLVVLKKAPQASKYIQPYDKPVLAYLKDIRVESYEGSMGFSIHFEFDSNPNLENETLTKSYKMRCLVEGGVRVGPEITDVTSTPINWKQDITITKWPEDNFIIDHPESHHRSDERSWRGSLTIPVILGRSVAVWQPFVMELPLSSPAKCELRSVIRFLNAKNNSPVEIHRQLVEVYGEKCMDIKNVRKWCREFNEGRINVHDEQRSGRPSLPESTVARIDEMVHANRRITLEEIEDGLNEDCSHFSVHKIVSETLGYRKVSARWVDKWLKEAAGEWYNTGITKLVDRMKKVIEHQGDYVEK